MGEMTAVSGSIGGATDALPARRRFTVDEYSCLAEAGILRPDERVELLNGEIYEMAAIGSRHAGCVNFLAEWFMTRLAGRAVVAIQNPVRLNNGAELEPDVAILRQRADRYAAAHPGPADVLLLIEVADTSLGYDSEMKLPAYAAAGIPEVWIADLNGERVLTHRGPSAAGYQQVETVERGGMLTPAAFPGLTLPVSELLGDQERAEPASGA